MDTLPDLSSDYPLRDADIAAFQRDGHVTLRGVCSPGEIAAYRTQIREATFAKNRENRPLQERDTYGKAFLQTLNLRHRHAGVMAFVTSRRIGKIAAELMGVTGARVYHDQSLFKEPGGGANPTPWHQDQYYWPFAEPTMLGLWMPLVDVAEDMGGMLYASGTHRLGFLGQHEISDGSQALYDRLIQDRRIPVVQVPPMQAGDACFHAGWTLHGARPNASDRLREAMVVAYFADGMRVATPTNPHQENDRLRYLAGRLPGELADSERNPLVFRAG